MIDVVMWANGSARYASNTQQCTTKILCDCSTFRSRIPRANMSNVQIYDLWLHRKSIFIELISTHRKHMLSAYVHRTRTHILCTHILSTCFRKKNPMHAMSMYFTFAFPSYTQTLARLQIRVKMVVERMTDFQTDFIFLCHQTCGINTILCCPWI